MLPWLSRAAISRPACGPPYRQYRPEQSTLYRQVQGYLETWLARQEEVCPDASPVPALWGTDGHHRLHQRARLGVAGTGACRRTGTGSAAVAPATAAVEWANECLAMVDFDFRAQLSP